MSFHAANPAGFPHLSPCRAEQANQSFSTCNYGGEFCPSYNGHACSNRTAIAANFPSQDADENFALARVGRYVSRLCSGTASGLFMRPAAARSSASAAPPCGLRFPSNLVRKDRRKDFSGASVNAELRHLGAWPTRLMVPRPRSGDSTNGDHHVPEQSDPHRLPR